MGACRHGWLECDSTFAQFPTMPVYHVAVRVCDNPGCKATAFDDEIDWKWKWSGFYVQEDDQTRWKDICPTCTKQDWRDSSRDARRPNLIIVCVTNKDV